MRSLNYDLDSMLKLENFNKVPQSVEERKIPLELNDHLEFDIEDFLITKCSASLTTAETQPYFNY